MSEKLERTVETAEYAHEGQKRKGTDIDYITHPLEVKKIVEGCGASEDACIAALFHDILEDVPAERYSEQRMREEYGDRVVEIVKGLSEPKQAGGPRKPWKERKDAYLQHLAATDDEDVLVVCAGDKIANLESMLADYEKVGEELWKRFNAGKEQQRWYYEQVLRILADKLSDESEGTKELVTRLRNAVAKLRSIVPYHVVICVLSALSSDKLPKLDSYTIAGDVVSEGQQANEAPVVYEGRQTNEAPVRFLLDHAKGSITEVLCLCSKDCTESRTFDLDEDEAIKLSDQGFLLDGEDSQENQAKGYSLTESSLTITTERYFKESLRAFCESKEIRNPIFTPIAYEPGNPERSIGEIVRHIRSNTTIDIDTTGGPRDAVLLLSLAANVIFAQSDDTALESAAVAMNSLGSHVAFGRAVYSNNKNKLIRSQDATFRLFRLISAVQAFTRYGKADLLKGFFEVDGVSVTQNKGKMRKHIISLCRNMEAFSDALSLCKVAEISTLVQHIHGGLRNVEKDGRKSQGEDTAALLFCSLVPAIRERFIPSQDMLGGVETPRVHARACAWQHVKTIRWCVERQMLQQALAIYVEKIPHSLFEAGLLEWGEGAPKDVEGKRACDVVKELSMVPSEKKGAAIYIRQTAIDDAFTTLTRSGIEVWRQKVQGGTKNMKLVLTMCYPGRFLDGNTVSVTKRGQALLPFQLAVYGYVNWVRNAIMHADFSQGAEALSKAEKARDRLMTLARIGGLCGDAVCVPQPRSINLPALTRFLTTILNVLDLIFEDPETEALESFALDVYGERLAESTYKINA